MATKKVKADSELYSPLEMYCIGLHEYYKALRKAGFATDMAFGLIMDRASYPDWLLPKIPVLPEDPNSTEWEDDD